MGRARSKDGEPKPGSGCPDDAEDEGNKVGLWRRTESRGGGGGGTPAANQRGWLLLTAPMAAHLSGISSSGHSHCAILPLSAVSNGPLDAPPQTGPAIVHSH